MERFGLMEINDFSRYVPNANDTFKISVEEQWYLSGVINDNVFHLALARDSDMAMKTAVESEIIDWMAHR
jgi:hypothetical protein